MSQPRCDPSDAPGVGGELQPDAGPDVPTTLPAGWRPEYLAPARGRWWWICIAGRKRPRRPGWGPLIRANDARGHLLAEVKLSFPTLCVRLGGGMLLYPPLLDFWRTFPACERERMGHEFSELWLVHCLSAENLLRRRKVAIREATPWRPMEGLQAFLATCVLCDEVRTREVRRAVESAVAWYRKTRRRIHRRPGLTARQRRLSQLFAAISSGRAPASSTGGTPTDSGKSSEAVGEPVAPQSSGDRLHDPRPHQQSPRDAGSP